MIAEDDTHIRFSAIESKGLGFNVWRGKLNTVDTDNLQKIIKSNKVDVSIISIPAEKKDLLIELQAFGYPVIFADVLIYYRLPIGDFDSSKLNDTSDIELVQYQSQHVEAMDELIADIFCGYHNHYTANPLLSADIVSAYQEWAKQFYSEDTTGRTAWLAKQGDAYIGFIACEFTNQSCEIRLTGVATAARGRGVFNTMLGHLIQYCKATGISTITVSTQLHNYASQGAYTKKGFLIDHAFITVHINSMLSQR